MKKRGFRILFAVALGVLLSLGALAGCNFKKTEINKIDPDADASDKPALKVLLPYVSDTMNSNPAIGLINEMTGYTVSYDQLPTGASAESNLTGIIIDKKTDYNALKLTKNQFNKYAVMSAAFADITDVVNSPKFSVMKNAIKQEAWDAVTYNGRILGVPDSASNDNIDKSIIIRKDIMYTLTNPDTGEKYTEVPKTFEGFKKLLQAFKAQTGKTTAFTLPSNLQVVGPIAAAFGVKQEWEDKDGELKHMIENPGFADYVTQMRALRTEGLLDGAMQTNSFAHCAQEFAKGNSIATVSNFWEMATVSEQLNANGGKKMENCVDFAYGFKDANGNVNTWQSSGVSYVTVIPNWMASSGIHVMHMIQEKLRDENFVRLVAGDAGVHYNYNSITKEYEPTARFAQDKTSADHFVTGTNDRIYNTWWTQVVVKGNNAYYFQWRNTNTDAFTSADHPLTGVLNPVKFAPPLKTYSGRAAGMEDYFNTEVTKLIYGNDSSVTVESVLAGWSGGENAAAVKEIKDWYKNK